MFVSPQIAYVEAITSNVTVFQGLWETIRVKWSHEGEALMMGLVPLQKETPVS